MLGAATPPLMTVAYRKLRPMLPMDIIKQQTTASVDEQWPLHDEEEQWHVEESMSHSGMHEQPMPTAVQSASPPAAQILPSDELIQQSQPTVQAGDELPPVQQSAAVAPVATSDPVTTLQAHKKTPLIEPEPETQSRLKIRFILDDFAFTVDQPIEDPPPATLPRLVELLARAGTERARRPIDPEHLTIEYGLDSGSDEPIWLTATSATHVGSVIGAAHGLRVTETSTPQPSLAPPPPLPKYSASTAPDPEVAARMAAAAKTTSPALAWLASLE